MDTLHELTNVALRVWEHHATVISVSVASGLALNSLLGGFRVGPGRALGLAIRSRLFRRADPFTARTEELAKLRSALATKKKERYVVVVGPKGVGKTVLVRSATATCGVVDVEVDGGTSGKEILRDAYSAIVGNALIYKLQFMNPMRAALRVLRFYKLLNFVSRQAPTVVFHLKERPQNKGEFAAITGAVRTLSDQGFRVIVDSSTHAAPIDLLNTTRQIVFEVDFMPAAVVARIPEYRALFSELEKYHLVPLVWEVVGGYPAALDELYDASKNGDPERQVYEVLKEHLLDAEKGCADLAEQHSDASSVFGHFRSKTFLPYKAGPMWLKTDTRVFRTHIKSDAIVPKTPTHAFVLQHQSEGRDLSKCSLDELKSLCSIRVSSFEELVKQEPTKHD